MSNTKREEKAIDRAIDESKESAKKVLQDVKRELPEVTATFHDYQEQNIKAIREMTTSYLEAQKDVAKVVQSSVGPLNNNAFTMMFYPWMHPQILADMYVKSVSNFADVSVSAARLSSEMMQVGMESVRSSIDATRNNTKIVSGYMSEVARNMEDAGRTSGR
jgi:hypothetical protein